MLISVVTGKRQEGTLQVLILARQLAVYTVKISKNENVFPKSYRWILTQKIVNEAVDALNCIRRANATALPTEKMSEDIAKDNIQYRYNQQRSAYAHYCFA